MEDLLFCITSTIKFKNTRQKYIKDTWLLGKSNFIFVSDFDDKDNVKIVDDTEYNSCDKKLVDLIGFIANNEYYHKYKWFFCCDDDTYVNMKRFKQMYEDEIVDEDLIYCKILSKTSDPLNPIWSNIKNLEQYPSGGAGFFISLKNVMKTYHSAIYKNIPYTGLGDVTMGILHESNKISLSNIDILATGNEQHPNISIADCKNYATLHHVKTKEHFDIINHFTK